MYILSIFLEGIKHFDNHIHQLYTKSSYLVDDESWPPFTPNKFINLLLIRHLEKYAAEYLSALASNIKTCHLNNDNEQSFTTNKISEIFQHGKKPEAHNKIILILGVPGIGKTVLSKEIAYQWADNKLLSEKEIVLMLFLRDPGIQKITELKHLVHYFYGFSKDRVDISIICAKQLLKMGGSNVTIILDGLDEIPAEVINNTYMRLLLDRKALPCCRIVVTSRPAVSIAFQNKVDIEVEILGFTDENINSFIQNELKEDKQKKLNYYFKQNKNLYHLCYIPFILSVLICITKEHDELPSNRVEVYTKFVIYTISRFLKRFEHSDHAISNINQLPVEYKSYLFELSKYAFKTLEIDQVVFTRKDITKDFPILANAPETLYGLGLLNTVKYFKISEHSDCVSYNFLHKSIQEFLAALYVTNLSEAEQFNIIRNYFFQEKYLNMWIIYIGLSEDLFSFWHFLSGNKLYIWSKWFGITGISTKILYSKFQCLYLFHCFSELRDESMCNLVGTLFQFGKLDLSNCTLSLNEINTMIFILERSTTTHWSELNLSHCNIGDAGCQYLCKGLFTLNHKIYFDEIDVDNNRLSLESLQHLVSLLVHCKTQKLYATNNIITMDNAKIAYLVMEYAFAVKALTNPLSIIVNRKERVIFCQSENKAIITYLKTRYMVSGLYCINCQLNDELIELLTDTIVKQEMIIDLYFWNSSISEDYLRRILSAMPQENRFQFLFVYEAIKDGNYIVAITLPAFISFTFIYLSKLSLILCNASYSHINHLIFANPMLPETTLIETMCLSHCELSDETIKLLIQLLNRISTIMLLNNTFDSGNLNQLMHNIKSKDLLSKITVYQNNMTIHDINLLENEFKKVQMLLINDKEVRGYNCCDEQIKYASQISPPLTALRIHYCDIKDYTLTSLYKLFQHCDHLREITIFYCLIDIPTTNKLLQHISTITTLTTLNLRGNQLTEETSQALASIISSNTGLEELYLANNQLQLGVIKLSTALKNISSIKVLDLNNNNIPEEVADELSAAISANTSLEKLWLSDNHLGSSTVMIVNALKDISTLKEIWLDDNQNRSEELAPALTFTITKSKLLERLLLSDNNLNDDGIIKIAHSLCKHSKLKCFNLRNNNITEEAAEALASIISSNTGLEELYLANNQLQLGVIKLSTALKNISSIKVLDLYNNNIPEEVADELSAAIRANNSLEKLRLNGNHLGSSTVKIVNALKDISTLKEIMLDGNQNRSEELAPALTSTITKSKLIEILLLSDNNLNDDGVIKIAHSLCKHSKLKCFNLRNNNITEEAAEALASIISSNTGLEELYLANNQLQLGVIKISTALKNISSIKVLDLYNNNIPEQVADELSAAISANTSLEKFWLSYNHLGSSTVMIVNALKDISTLKEIWLDDNQNRSEELAPALTFTITKSKLLERLLLSDNNLNDDGVIKIAHSLCKHSKLKCFNLQNNNITEEAAEALASIISSNTGLEELYLANNQLQLGVIKISTALKNISSIKVLDLDNNNIPEEVADELSAAIRANNSLEKLWLSGNHLGSSTVMIVNALKDISTLKEISLNGNQNRSEELAPALTSTITKSKLLERLLLSDNNLNDDGVIKIAHSLCKHSKLKCFNLQNNNITEEAAEAFASIISSNTGLEELYLGNNQLQLGVIKISTALKNISSIKVLDLDNNNIPEEVADQLSAAIRANNSLEKLWLSDNHLGSSTVMIVNALKDISTLKEISLNGNQNRIEELAPALTSTITKNKLLERLLLSDNNLNDDGVIKIAHSLCKHSKLKCFNLRNNNITEEAAEALASIISSNTGLEELYLANNQLQLGVIKISTALKNISSIKVLDLYNNNIPEQVADELSAAISANTSLEKFWLSYNHLGSSTVMIVNALKDISTLKEIWLDDNQNRSEELAPALTFTITKSKLLERLLLSDNNLNDDGVIKIAHSLCKHSKLKCFNLQNNNITEEAAEALVSIISSNTGLEELYLANNQLQLGVIKISTALKNISSIKVLDLDNNNIPEEVADQLSAAIRANNSLEKLWLSDNHLGSSTVTIVNALKDISTLKEISLNGNQNRSEELAPALTSTITKSKLLEILLLSDNNLNDDGVIKIAHSLCKHSKLKCFNLRNNNITEEAAEALASIISSNTGLEELYLYNNQLQLGVIKISTALKNISSIKMLDLDNNNIPEEVADELSAAIRANNSLEKLWLSDNHLGSSTVMIVNALKDISTLKEISLNGNQNRSEELAPALTSTITKNKLLERLLLSDNNLNDDGVIKIAHSLCKHSKLKCFNLRNNNITEEAAEALASIISSNTGLEELYLANNQLQLGVIKISTALKNISSIKVLDLTNNNIPEEVADELSAAIRANNSLEKLRLNGNHLGSSTIKIVNALKDISTLKEISLNGNQNRSEELAPALTSTITKSKLLERLLLSDNNLNDDGVIKIAHSLCKHSKLKCFNLRNNNITEEAAEALASIISSNTGLEELYLDNNQLQLGVIKISTALKNISSIKMLDLTNNNIPEEVADELSAAIRANNSLEKLRLNGNHLGSSTIKIVNALKDISTLKEISLNGNQNRSEELAPALTSTITKSKLLERLLLSDNNLNDDGVIKIAHSLCKHSKLKCFNLRNNNITEEAAEALASIISSNTGLEELYLDNNQLQLGVINISTALKNISSIKVLDLYNNNIPEQVADELSAAISANTSLEKFWLSDNHLGSSTVKIVNALKDISTLKEIRLDGNQSRSEELSPALTSTITKNKLIEILLLSDNNLNDDGVIKIAHSLCKHSNLKCFNLRNNNITKEAAEALASIISSNTGLEELYLANNQLQLGVIKISTALKNISSIKVLDLYNNNIPEQVADELSAAISANTSLEKFWLNDNHLGSSTVMIVNALKDISTLKEISLNGNQNRSEELAPALTSTITKSKLLERLLLSDNNLNDDGIIKIAHSLCKHSKLKCFNLRNNNITEEAAEALASIISSNTGLEELYLANNQLQLGVIKISTALKNISSIKVLDLTNNNIPEEVADELSAAIRANNSLEKLRLNGNHLGSSTIKIVNALKDISTLKEIWLDDNQNRSEELAPALTSTITKSKLLERLLLSDNNLNDDGVIKIAHSLCKHSKLKCFNLRNNNITEEAAEALASIISSNTGLEELYLANNQLQLGVIKISTALKNISSIKVLDLDNNNIPEEVADELSAAIRANNSLDKLWLSDNHLGSSTVMIVNALKDISTLKEISLNGNQNRSEELAPALTSTITKSKLLERLLLSDNNLNDDGVIKIAHSLCKHSKLKCFNLRNNNITEEAAEALASIISSNTGLEELYLDNNQLQLGVIKISTALKNISSIKMLDLDNNNIPEEVADELSAAIRANNSLEKLWLSDNHLGSSTVMIVNALKDISTLKEISLNGNQNRSEELAPALTSTITKSKLLERLLLSDNNLNDDGVIKIAHSLCKHSNLKCFNLRNNNITEEAAEALASIISSNTGLEKLYLGNNQLQLGVIKLSTALKNISSLKVLDLDNNNIQEQAADELSSVIVNNLSLEKIFLSNNLLENGLIQIVESHRRLANLKILELSHNCISPTQVVNLASSVSKCISLEVLSLGGVCFSVNETLYFNVYRIRNHFHKNISNTLTQGIFFNKNLYELTRMKICQLSLLNYDLLSVTYQYRYFYISYWHQEKFDQVMGNNTDYDLIIQEAKQKLSQIDSKTVISSLLIIRILKVINLENNNINEDAATELVGHLHRNDILEQLWLRGNELYDKGASVILQSLYNLSTLLILDLSFNHLSSESADGIAVVIGNNCSLQQLWLDGNDLLTRGVARIASALKKLSSLRILSLCSNGITVCAAEEISNVITSNVLLVDLLLGNNQLQATGICKIAMAMKETLLMKLDLSNNHITPDAAEELAVTLSNCTNLQQLFLNDNILGTKGTIKLANALKCINTLQVLTLSNNNITESATDVLVGVLRNNISLKIVLIGGNDLRTTGVNLIVQTAKNITTLQLLDVSDNNVSEDEKENFRTIFANYNNFTIVV